MARSSRYARTPAPVTIRYADGQEATVPADHFEKRGGRKAQQERKHDPSSWHLLQYAEFLRRRGDPRSKRGRKLRRRAFPNGPTPTLKAMHLELAKDFTGSTEDPHGRRVSVDGPRSNAPAPSSGARGEAKAPS